MQHPRHLLPDMMVGPWRIKGPLGTGGFGAVFRVESAGTEYALKFAVHGPDSEDLNRTDARARRELACLLLISHPNVVRVWGHGRWPDPRSGFHYVVMDYVEGLTLVDWVKQARPTPRQVVRLFDTLALTLAALHAQGVHHRDLKGTNILVRAADGQPVLVDFGAAEHSAVSSPLTEGPLPPGTPHLRTPEALRFHREQYTDPEARYPFQPTDELYALGATLYEVLTGAPPFPPHLPRDVLIGLIETKMPASPDTLNPSVPPALAELVLRLLAKRPEERPASGRVLHEQFQALLRDEAPAWDAPLLPGADTATTEGMGAAPVAAPIAVPVPSLERLPPPPVSEASAPTVAPARQAPRRWRWALATLTAGVLLAVALAALRGGGDSSPGLPPPPPTAMEAPSPLEALPPLTASDSGTEDTLPFALPSTDAGTWPLVQAPLSLPPQKGPSLMRPKAPAKHSEPPQAPEPEQPRGSGASPPSKFAGALAACILTGSCASTDPVVRPDGALSQLCPPGAAEAMRRDLGISEPVLHEVAMPGNHKGEFWEEGEFWLVREGRHEVTTFEQLRWKKMPVGTAIIGDFFIGDRLYARFTEVRFPDGRRFPFCGHLVGRDDGETGQPFLKGSKDGAMKVLPVSYVSPDFYKH
ncbi:serine/threonine protein kinase [Hyalangium rubrum]|uniref:non-specific serine/threonine protein kinase n=1 Tax=Hyalangium rubrum TaxID=3103134 RepID=A0ABU5HD62_9BACT|nr:serine/threonine-protein kinase [Hyalangium sp. s54d21]MDY7231281.1 serine/threonine-protein kinase [Hyalangium sp. s54d21]